MYIVYERPDKTICIAQLLGEFESSKKRIEETSVIKGEQVLKSYKCLGEFKEFPKDFRNAWVVKDGAIEIDLEKAKEVKKEQLRHQRAKVFQELDVEYQRADETGDEAKKKEVIAKKQELRDLPLLCDKASSVEDLRNIKIYGG